MAKQEHDREDLLAEGRAMSLRGEAEIAGRIVVVGFRHRTQLSLYCGADPVFQFNGEGALRRAYREGQRYAAENGHLVLLSRDQSGGRVRFDRSKLSPEQTGEILADMNAWLERLRQVATSELTSWRVVEASSGEFRSRLLEWLRSHPGSPEVASVPSVGSGPV